MSTNALATAFQATAANAASAASDAIAALDLGQIKMKLMHVESGEGWSAARADAVETEYRRFLFLMKKYPDAEASPTVDVDTFWHYHILDTMKYARDCEAVFGYFLHHYPYVGIGADAGDDDHAAGGERMRAIYEAEFGAGPAVNDYAFCSSPGTPREAAGSAQAFCSSPGTPRKAAGAGAAFCSSPGAPRKTAEVADTAFCSSPGTPRQAANARDFAFCSSPGAPRKAANAADYAFCSSPGTPRQSASAAHAFCSSPSTPREAANAAYAFCSSPSKPRESANAAYAFCSSPGKTALAA
ncbi:glycine-rich domain-containing protein-like [uncultured Massilia sp.]|uniref:glycine-rich domain-containing protein n=1 Tax=uncultured Massilia sp. TaxID=169973 RepID=UPI0025856755|nr:glycine-rich domain-containing protein-like [uncultured Massilia sp.]